MDWNCKISEERLSEYLDGMLSPEECVRILRACCGSAQIALTWSLRSKASLGHITNSKRSKLPRIWPIGFWTRRSARASWKTMVHLGADPLAAAIRDGNHHRRGFAHDRDSLHRHNPGKTQARRLESSESSSARPIARCISLTRAARNS